MKRPLLKCATFLMALAACVTTCPASRSTYTDPTLFLQDAAALGLRLFSEGFEDPQPWDGLRTTATGGTHTAASVTAGHLTWLPNNTLSQLTTAPWPARTGDWGFYELPHGDWINAINDGWIIHADRTLHAAGGWLVTNTPPAAVEFYLDNDPAHPVDFNPGDTTLSTAYQFLGVIDTQGFTGLEVRETEGQLGDFKFIFTDDWTFGYRVPGDFNTDGLVDQDDLTLLLSSWGNSTVPPEWSADFDGLVDQSELDDLLSNWGSGILSPPDLLDAAVVPLPATAAWGLLLAGCLARRR